ncbi:hypothetical protein AEAC466_03715 [Asticcacaulis sp. AC466]|nr:hypothetical protein AEAC466_03715 [Asticcacaulis sp. AC466]
MGASSLHFLRSQWVCQNRYADWRILSEMAILALVNGMGMRAPPTGYHALAIKKLSQWRANHL